MPQSTPKSSERTVSFVIPFYNERLSLPRLVEVLNGFAALAGPRWHLRFDAILVDDGSSDGGRDVLLAAVSPHLDLRILRLSRNFGKELALSAGLQAAKADAVVVMDADLQHPVEVVESFLKGWLEEGYDVVYAYGQDALPQGAIKRALRRLYYRLMNATAEVEIPGSVGDFQLMAQPAYRALTRLGEHERFMKGLYRWIGFRQKGVPYTPATRHAGATKYSMVKLWALAINGITSFTTLPLRVASWIGVLLAFLSGGYGIWTIIEKLVFGNDVPGYPTLITIIGFIGAGQFLFLGIIGEYLAKVLIEVKQRPLYIIESDDVVKAMEKPVIVDILTG
jgi:glycosyltransferase involved in cell wall biosynthesis